MRVLLIDYIVQETLVERALGENTLVAKAVERTVKTTRGVSATQARVGASMPEASLTSPGHRKG